MSTPDTRSFSSPGERLSLRTPTVKDAPAIWQLVRDTGVLDLNSPYSYVILCHHFADTCLVAEQHGTVVGFVTAYRPPTSPDVIFVWQIGVAKSMQGRRLGFTILTTLLRQDACQEVSYLEATVTPSNAPSQALFRSLARHLDTQCVESPCFAEHLFPTGDHEAEYLFRIGPFRVTR